MRGKVEIVYYTVFQVFKYKLHRSIFYVKFTSLLFSPMLSGDL